jgi:hypothetical protein
VRREAAERCAPGADFRKSICCTRLCGALHETARIGKAQENHRHPQLGELAVPDIRCSNPGIPPRKGPVSRQCFVSALAFSGFSLSSSKPSDAMQGHTILRNAASACLHLPCVPNSTDSRGKPASDTRDQRDCFEIGLYDAMYAMNDLGDPLCLRSIIDLAFDEHFPPVGRHLEL